MVFIVKVLEHDDDLEADVRDAALDVVRSVGTG